MTSEAGIYIHVPYCAKACSYCDFYFSVNHISMPDYLRSLEKEIEMRKDFFSEYSTIHTIYFGGGTPSLLTVGSIEAVLKKIKNTFQNIDLKEITIEANPEHITKETLSMWYEIGINRISLGVQALQNHHLQKMNRNHTAESALSALELISNSKIQNFSVDVIFGLPNSDLKELEQTLEQILFFQPKHISTYSLTVEKNTLLHHQVETNKVILPSDEDYILQYEFVNTFLQEKQFYRYELSNFAKQGYEAIHNSMYWKHKPYLGLGPSAHSFDGKIRSSNVSNVHRYIEKIEQGKSAVNFEEKLTPSQLKTEELMFNIRQNLGIERDRIPNQTLLEWKKMRLVYEENGKIKLSDKGMLLSDSLILEIV